MALPGRLRAQLERLVGEDAVVCDRERLDAYARDETPNLEPRFPDAVVRPQDAAQVRKVVALCARHRVPVTPRGAGTGHSGGCVPACGGVVVDATRMNRIVEISPDDMVAVVEPGVVLADLQAAVEEAGLFYPPDPNSLESCTLGGNVAENAGGPRAVRYGVTRDYVLGLDLVVASGDELHLGHRSIKGVSGYDLTSLVVGSEGTLGVITRIVLKLVPLPRAVATALVTFDSAERASRTVTRLLGSGLLVRALEFLDRRSIDAVRDLAAFRFPPDIGAALLVETDGDDDEYALAQLERVADLCDAEGARQCVVAQHEGQRRDLWSARRLLTEATRRIRRHKIAEDIAVPRSRVPEAVAAVYAIGDRHGVHTAVYGHAGDGNLHVQICFDDPVAEAAAVEAAVRDVMQLAVQQLGGTLSGEHGIGSAKRRFMHLEHGPLELDMMRRVKHAFDPHGVMNPGKIFP